MVLYKILFFNDLVEDVGVLTEQSAQSTSSISASVFK